MKMNMHVVFVTLCCGVQIRSLDLKVTHMAGLHHTFVVDASPPVVTVRRPWGKV